MKGVFNYIFKIIFGFAVVLVGLQGLINIKQYVSIANNNVDKLREQNFFNTIPLLELIKENTKSLVLIHFFFFVIGGFLSVLELKLSKLIITLAVIGNLIFINNISILKDEQTLINALKYIAIFGGVWNF